MIDLAVISIGILACVLLLINGAYMLVSPSAWFRLPGWLRANGGLPEGKYSRGWGAIQIRFLGALVVSFFVSVLAAVLFDELLTPVGGLPPSRAVWMFGTVVALYAAVSGVFMVVSPTKWDTLPRWLKVSGLPDPDRPFPWRSAYIRAAGAIILGTVGLMFYALLRS